MRWRRFDIASSLLDQRLLQWLSLISCTCSSSSCVCRMLRGKPIVAIDASACEDVRHPLALVPQTQCITRNQPIGVSWPLFVPLLATPSIPALRLLLSSSADSLGLSVSYPQFSGRESSGRMNLRSGTSDASCTYLR